MFTISFNTPIESIPELDSAIAKCQDVCLSSSPQDFEYNAFGFPLNEISALNGCRSVQEYNALLDKIQEYQANNPDTSKMSIQELIENVAPRSYQTPSEIIQAASWLGSRLQSKIDVAEEKRVSAAASASAVPAVTPPPAGEGVTTT